MTQSAPSRERIATIVLRAMQDKVDADNYVYALNINSARAGKAADEILSIVTSTVQQPTENIEGGAS